MTNAASIILEEILFYSEDQGESISIELPPTVRYTEWYRNNKYPRPKIVAVYDRVRVEDGFQYELDGVEVELK